DLLAALIIDRDTQQRGPSVYLWDTKAKKEVGQLRCGSPSAWQLLAFTRDGKTLVVSTRRVIRSDPVSAATVEVWDVPGPTLRNSFRLPQSRGGQGALSPDGKTLAVGPGGLSLYDLHTGKESATLAAARISAMAFSRDGRWLASYDVDGKVTCWDVKARKP